MQALAPAPNSLAPSFTVQEIAAGGCSLLFCAAQRDQLVLLFGQLDLKLIAWLEVEPLRGMAFNVG